MIVKISSLEILAKLDIQDRRVHTAMFKSSGYTAPLLWYDAEYEGFNLEDNKSMSIHLH